MRRHLAFVAFVLAAGCGSFTEAEEPAEEPKEATPSAPGATPPPSGGGAASTEEATQPTEPSSTTKPACAVGFQADVMPRLVATCGGSACHESVSAPFVSASDAKATYDALMAFQFGSLEWNDPHADISGAQEADFKKTITSWRMCGARFD